MSPYSRTPTEHEQHLRSEIGWMVDEEIADHRRLWENELLTEENITAVASALAIEQSYNPNDYSISEWTEIRDDYLAMAEVAIRAISEAGE